jgi:hypothetical protein
LEVTNACIEVQDWERVFIMNKISDHDPKQFVCTRQRM